MVFLNARVSGLIPREVRGKNNVVGHEATDNRQLVTNNQTKVRAGGRGGYILEK